MRWIRDDSGMSLTELLVVSVLIGVIMTASYFMFNAAQAMNDSAVARSNAADEAQRAIDTMTRELRQSQVDDDSAPDKETPDHGVFRTATATEVKFMSDLNADRRPELVRYYVEGGSLKRTVAPPTTMVPPFSYGSPGAPTILVEKLGTTTNPVFCYHDRTPNTTVLCGTDKHGFAKVTSADPYNTSPKIAMVGITMDVVGESGARDVTVTSRALVRVRTILNKME